jgi:peptide-methionine (R)-S-oxide reductase
MLRQPHASGLTRRRFVLHGAAAAVAGIAVVKWFMPADSTAAAAMATATSGRDAPPLAVPPGSVEIENFAATGKSEGVISVAKVVRTDAEWHAALTPLAYRVTRQASTEAPFSGEYAESHADGLYRCICCATALFDAKTKFDSGTGWPSFWQAISTHNVAISADSSFGMQRDAVSCRRCDAHLGHVFDDGPRPTGLRYCMNSVSLSFVVRA